MPSDVVGRFYQRLLTSPEIEVGCQRRIFSHGVATRDAKLLAKLAAHPDLDAGIDTELPEVGMAAVVSAWVSRPGRGAGEVAELATKERRVGVLTALAGIEGLEEPVYLQIASRGHLKSSLALVENPTVPHSVKCVAVAVVGRIEDPSWNQRRRIEDLIRVQPELADAFMSTVVDVQLVEIGAGGDLSEEVAGRVARLIISAIGPKAGNWQKGTALRTAQLLGNNPSLPETGRERLVVAVRRVIAEEGGAHYSGLARDALRSLTSGSRRRQDGERIQLARTSTEATELDALVAETTATGSRSLASALCANRSTTVEQVVEVAHLASIGSMTLEARREDTEVFSHLAAMATYHCNDALLARCSDPAGTLVAVLGACARRGRTTLPAHLIGSRFLGERAMLALPVSQLSQAELSPVAAQLLVEILAERLGQSDGAWAIFESLATSYDGTLSGLLEDCALIDS